MPRKASLRSLLAPFYHQTANKVAALRQEIARREKELVVLKVEMARWRQVANHQNDVTKIRAAKSTRIDWTALLQGLPARFTTKDVAAKTAKPHLHQANFSSVNASNN
jgi:hypothetical protein